jgi:hypothetical protein
METENSQVHDEREEEEEATDNMEPMECPYKKFKFDNDDAYDTASFVTNIEDAKDVDSNGDGYGMQQNLPTSELDEGPEGEGNGEDGVEGGSDDGEDCKRKLRVKIVLESSHESFKGGSYSENGLDSDENYEEIETMLDQALPDELRNKKKDYEERFKIIMEGELIMIVE